MGSLFGLGRRKGPSLAQKTADAMGQINQANAQNAATTAAAASKPVAGTIGPNLALKQEQNEDEQLKKSSGGFFGAGRGTFLGGGSGNLLG